MMPIVDVEVVIADNEQLGSGLAGDIADAAGDAFQTAAGRTDP